MMQVREDLTPNFRDRTDRLLLEPDLVCVHRIEPIACSEGHVLVGSGVYSKIKA